MYIWLSLWAQDPLAGLLQAGGDWAMISCCGCCGINLWQPWKTAQRHGAWKKLFLQEEQSFRIVGDLFLKKQCHQFKNYRPVKRPRGRGLIKKLENSCRISRIPGVSYCSWSIGKNISFNWKVRVGLELLPCLLYMGQVFKPEYAFVFAALWKTLG